MSQRRIRKLSGDPVKLSIQKLSHDGRGIATLDDGLKVFVTGALPGETVMARVLYKRSRMAEAELCEVLTPSPDRVTPPCAVFGQCGGCVLQHMSVAQQIRYKQEVLAEQFQHFGRVEPLSWLPAVQANPWGYRLKARLGVKRVDKKGGVLVGFREQNGRYLTDMTRCDILHPAMGQRLSRWREVLATLNASDQIAQLEVAIDDRGPVVILRHQVPLTEHDLTILKALADEEHCRLYLQSKGPETVCPLWPEQPEPLFYELPAHQVRIQYEPGDFTQVNQGINVQMVDLALQLLQLNADDRVLDLFCGLGNFSLPMARYAGHVVGVEGEIGMVKRAGLNAQRNGLANVEFHAANLFEVAPDAAFMQQRYTKVLLDPPRAGAEHMVRQLANLGVERIVYVACDPATLARDVGILVNEHGYRLEQAGVLDMFPHTRHVESIALIVR